MYPILQCHTLDVHWPWTTVPWPDIPSYTDVPYSRELFCFALPAIHDLETNTHELAKYFISVFISDTTLYQPHGWSQIRAGLTTLHLMSAQTIACSHFLSPSKYAPLSLLALSNARQTLRLWMRVDVDSMFCCEQWMLLSFPSISESVTGRWRHPSGQTERSAHNTGSLPNGPMLRSEFKARVHVTLETSHCKLLTYH